VGGLILSPKQRLSGLGVEVAGVSWRGGSSSNIHTKVLERMRRVLFEDVWYSYLQNNAKERLKQHVNLLKMLKIKANLLPLEGNTCCIFPWMGTVAYRTLERYLNFCCRETLDIKALAAHIF